MQLLALEMTCAGAYYVGTIWWPRVSAHQIEVQPQVNTNCCCKDSYNSANQLLLQGWQSCMSLCMCRSAFEGCSYMYIIRTYIVVLYGIHTLGTTLWA